MKTIFKKIKTKVIQKKKIVFSTIIFLFISTLISFNFDYSAKGAIYGWIQQSWIGGASNSSVADHTNNQSNWNRFFSKSNNISADTQITLNSPHSTKSDSTTTDFQKGTNIDGTYSIINTDDELKLDIPETIPANITLGAPNDYFIASIYDTDYLPYTSPTTPAILPGTATDQADGNPDTPTIDVQGTLTTTGVTIKIPYTVVTAPVELPAFSQTVNVPEEYTEDGISRDITLVWGAQSLAVGSGTFDATLKAEAGTLNARKLDIQTGIGDDVLGILLGQFTYTSNNSGDTENFDVRLISAIPDRNFGMQTTIYGQSPAYNHRFLYFPVHNSVTGETWLNNNLGANYANSNHAQFNPVQQATASTDWHAYGSLYQWGRLSDSHELINWTGTLTGTAVNPTTSVRSGSDTPADARFIIRSSGPYDWRNPQNANLWQGAVGTNNPCPFGWRVSIEAELEAERLSWGSDNAAGAFASPLKLPVAGARLSSNGSLGSVGSLGFYWSGTVSGTYSRGLSLHSSDNFMNSNYRASGRSVRCIKD